jgi:hypothetical protein
MSATTSAAGARARAGVHPACDTHRSARMGGHSAIEMLLAVPILLFVGSGALQFALVFHAKQALNHALVEAVRAGSVAHAAPDAIDRGLARGLVPYLYGAADTGEYVLNLGRAYAHVQAGRLQGWLLLERLAPTPESFADWAQPARDDAGTLLAGLVEIPNDNLSVRILSTQPASGATGHRDAEPIGRTSRQTLADANLLKLHLIYGVPVTVPVAGRLIAWALRAWDGCGRSGARRYGALGLDAPSRSFAPRPWACAFYGLQDRAAPWQPRIPVRLSATIRMQSPARAAGAAGG